MPDDLLRKLMGSVVPAQRGVLPPSSPLEYFLAEIWQEILETGPIGIEENFFDLGGDSLDAMEVLAAIELRTGARLPLNEIGDHPTIEGLAQAVERYQRRRMIGPLVVVRPEGTAPPLFLFDAMEVLPGLSAVEILRHVDPRYPTYLVKSVLVRGDDVSYTMNDLVATHVSAIQRVQPTGPYRLAGYCSGGYVALAVAHELHRAGETVDLLVLAHSPHPHAYLWRRYRGFAGPLNALVRKGALTPRQAAELYITDLTLRALWSQARQQTHSTRPAALAYLMRRAIQLGPRASTQQFRQWKHHVQTVKKALRTWVTLTYDLPHWPGRLIFVGAEHPDGDPHDTPVGWEGVAEALEMVRGPWRYRDIWSHIPELADLLNGYLREADRVSGWTETGENGAELRAQRGLVEAPGPA